MKVPLIEREGERDGCSEGNQICLHAEWCSRSSQSPNRPSEGEGTDESSIVPHIQRIDNSGPDKVSEDTEVWKF